MRRRSYSRTFALFLLMVAGLPCGLFSSPAQAAGGLTIKGTDAEVKQFKEYLEKCKKKSKMFKQLLEDGFTGPGNEHISGITSDKSPVTITVNVGRTGDYIDSGEGGQHTVDVNLDNLAKLPDPDIGPAGLPPGYEKWGLTRCEDIAHFLSEAYKNGTHKFDVTAHQFGIWVQNQVRKDFGLKTLPVTLQDFYDPQKTDGTYKPLVYRPGDPLAPKENIYYLGIWHDENNLQVIWFNQGKMYTWFYTKGRFKPPTTNITEMTATAPAQPAPGAAVKTEAPAGGAAGTPATTPTPAPTPPPKEVRSETPTFVPSQPPPPPPSGSSMNLPASPNAGGAYASLYVVGALSDVTTTERLADDGRVTNRFRDCCSGVGGGLGVGYDWPLGNNLMLGPVLGLSAPNDRVTHAFAGGGYLRSTVDFTATAKARASYIATPDLLAYAQAGIAVGNQEMSLNFGGPTSSHSQVTPGAVLGAGVEWRPFDRGQGLFGIPTAVFLDYDHIWWGDARFNTPTASPLFNYSWSRESNVITAGLRIRFADP